MQEATQMTMDEFFCYQEQTFDSFSKRVIKNIGIDLHNKQKALADIEVAFSALPKREMDSLFTEDTYLLGSEGQPFLFWERPSPFPTRWDKPYIFCRHSGARYCCCFTLQAKANRKSATSSISQLPL